MNKQADKNPDHVGAFAKGLRILECFSTDQPRLSITQASQASGLDRATARRCLLTLHHEGYADYDGKFFSLTPRALRLGTGALSAMPLPQLVQPWLDQLTEIIGQSCSVSLLEGTEIVYIARASQRRVMSIGLLPGSRLPSHCTTMGRVLLSALSDEEARAIISQCDLTPRTAFSLTDPTDIMAKLAEVRHLGYCAVDQEIEIGLRAVAVPLLNERGETVAALNTGVSAAVHSSVQEMVDAYLPALLKVQAGLKRML